MSGYTPVFSEIYMGSLYGRWPAAAVWASLLPLCDKNGVIDASPQAIAGMTGWPLDLLMQGITDLLRPDPDSRTPDDDGRRLTPLEGRPWGWRVVNHGKYREKARKMAYDSERTASGRDAERKRAERASVPRSPDASREVPLSDSDANTDPFTSSLRSEVPPTAVLPRAKRSATRIPEDFGLTPEREAYAVKNLPRVDAPALMEAFRDHWKAASGPKARKTDWDATWRTWVRNANQFGYPMVAAAAQHAAPQIRFDANGRQIGG